MNKANRYITQILKTGNDSKMIFIRLIVGLIFMNEGLLKYMSLEVYGPLYFNEIGFNHAFFWAYFAGAFEISCGFLILMGLMTRVASIPLFIIMIAAFVTTKIPLLFNSGFWTFAHGYSLDFSLTVLLIPLFIYGGGKWSIDLKILQAKHA
jgi:putative oxidoreductase